ncbi:MAG: hypothetical protein MJY45_06680 [Bacteroidales bacterium]|nr:hypothetical protein [Bacteroidales bacterium]
MNQKVFDTQWRVRELMEDAIAVWKQSNYCDQLLPLKDDPVFKLIMAAMARQANEIDNDIERFRTDVLNEFTEIFSSYDAGHATPASAVVRVAPVPGVGVVDVDSTDSFSLEGTEYRFLPVLKTRVAPVEITSVTRLDGRRWEVSLSFGTPVSDLSLMSFALSNPGFRDVRIWIGDRELSLIRPWEYSELPFSDIFAFENIENSGSTIYNPSMSLVDIFARHGLRMYFVRKQSCADFIPDEVMELKLVLEFEGVGADFIFKSEDLILNTVLLSNVDIREENLDSSHPIARITGAGGDSQTQLMHILTPVGDQMFDDVGVSVRRVAADRFNRATLVRLLSSLIDKYRSDYYAFSNMDGNAIEGIVAELDAQLHKLLNIAKENRVETVGGPYLMLDRSRDNDKVSVKIRYLTTDGSAASASLTEKSRFIPAGGLDSNSVVQVAPPVPGSDEVGTDDGKLSLEGVRRYQHTGNRIVTRNDIRVFCYKELAVRYGIVSKLIHEISVAPHLCDGVTLSGNNACGYEILVSIIVANTAFVRRNFCDRIPQAEILLEKMLQVRSVNIYPISVKIKVE